MELDPNLALPTLEYEVNFFGTLGSCQLPYKIIPKEFNQSLWSQIFVLLLSLGCALAISPLDGLLALELTYLQPTLDITCFPMFGIFV